MQLSKKEFENSFLKNGGELGTLVREMKWSNTSLGETESWPNSLRTALSIMFGSSIPMFVVWGKDKIFFIMILFAPFFLVQKSIRML
ncbi:hypothetical protein AAGS39_05670 [Flavobacterium sp. CGRL2]